MGEVKEVKSTKSEKSKKEDVPVSIDVEVVVHEEVVSEVSQEVIKETPLIVKGFSRINRSFRKNNK